MPQQAANQPELVDHTGSLKFQLKNVLKAEHVGTPGYDYLVASYQYADVSVDDFLNPKLSWPERYKNLLPYSNWQNVKSVGEGNTPLIESKQFANCWIKDEARNPSGCFKDRESAVLITHLVEQGYDQFVMTSSGNAALSSSLYSKLHGAHVDCYVPQGTSKGKMDLIKAYGGGLVELGDDYEACYHAVADLDLAENVINVTSGMHPLREQGDKLIAYELWQELGDEIDKIVVPTANGSLLTGIYLGYYDLVQLGLAKKIPQLIAIQIEDAAPIAKALMEGEQDHLIVADPPDSKAEGLVAAESYVSPKALHALTETKGKAYTVAEAELKPAMQKMLTTEGILPEWTSVTVFAALQKLYSSGEFNESEKIVVINSGSGLKSIAKIADYIIN